MKSGKQIVVVEDDLRIAQLLVDYLRNEGFEVHTYANGQVALDAVRFAIPDLLILDVMLPGLDGVGLCRALRQFSEVPILMLTARVAESDRVLGLSSGADDYVCKPFSPREVMARVHALLRRAHGAVMAPQTVWQVDDAALRVTWKGNALPLTTVEFRIFRALMARRGSVCSRSQLIDVSHMDARDVSDRAIDTHVKNIRRKVQSVVPHFKGLESVYGVGYRLEIDD